MGKSREGVVSGKEERKKSMVTLQADAGNWVHLYARRSSESKVVCMYVPKVGSTYSGKGGWWWW